MSTTLIDRLTALVDSGEASRSGLARAAGLHPNSLRKLGSPEWNPTADTLTRLERLLHSGSTEVLVGAERIIDEARNGRMFILVDDDDRENEGDLIIPGQMATPDAINFMARHGRGLICLALTQERADALQLQPMASSNRSGAIIGSAHVAPEQQVLHQRLLHVQPVFCLVPDDRLRPLEHVLGHLFAAVRGQTVHEERIGTRRAHHRRVDAPAR